MAAITVATLAVGVTERPAIAGLALPGMPSGTPGMAGQKTAPFQVLQLVDGGLSVYMTL